VRGEGVAVAGLWARLGATAAVTLALGAGCWAVLQAAGVDPAIAESAAAGLAAVVVTLGTVWASRAGGSDPGQSAGAPMVARSPGALATRDVQGAVFGPGSDFAGASIFIASGVSSETVPAGRRGPRGAEDGPVVVGDIPQEPTAFQHRPNLLDTLLHPPSGGRVTVVYAVTGMRGVGKTQLAAACARRRLIQGWRVVAWIAAEDRQQLLAGYEQLAGELGLAEDGQDSAQSAARVRHWLEADGTNCLLVLDNANSADAVRPFLPAAGRAQVIVTSWRQTLASLGTPVPVDVFTPDEATAFLAERTGRNDEHGARLVAEELGYLPLALAQAAAVIAGQQLDYPTYLRRLAAVPAADYLIRTEEDPYPRSAAEAILLALDTAERPDPSGLVRQLLEITSLLSPSGTPRALMVDAADVSEEAADAALQQLAAASLVTWSLDGSSVTIHRLVMRITRERAAHDSTLRAAAARVITALQAMQPTAEEAWQRPRVAQELVGQVIVLTSHLAAFPDIIDGQVGEDLLRLRAWAGWYLNEVSDIARAVPLLELNRADCQRAFGPDHPSSLSAAGNLAYAYLEAGHLYRAILLYEQNLADRLRIMGPDHPDTLTARNNLARAYMEAARPHHAIYHFEQNLADSRRVLGPDHRITLAVRNSLGNAYKNVGRLDQAIAFFEQTAADFERLVGPDHPDTLTARDSVASAYQNAGRMDEAVPLFEQNLADRLRIMGPNHPDTLTAGGKLASAYQHADRLDEAIPLLAQNLAERLRIMGPDHPDTLTARNSLAYAYLDAGLLEQTIRLYEQNLADRLRIMGPDHPDTLIARNNLATAYHDAGLLDQAIPLLAQNLAAQQRIMGPDHPDTLTTRNMLAAAYQDTGSPDQAISLVEQNLVDRGDLLGDGKCGEARPGAESFQHGVAAVPSLRGPEYPTDRRLGDPDDLVRLPDGSAVDTTERVVFRNGDYLDCRLENLEWWDERVRGPVPQPDAARGNDALSLISHRASCGNVAYSEPDSRALSLIEGRRPGWVSQNGLRRVCLQRPNWPGECLPT